MPGFLRNWEQGLKIYALVCRSLIDFNEVFIPNNELQFLDWPNIVAHSPTDLMYIPYGLVILVLETFRSLPQRPVTYNFIRALSVRMQKKNWLKSMILNLMYSECLSHMNKLLENDISFSLEVQMVQAKMNLNQFMYLQPHFYLNYERWKYNL